MDLHKFIGETMKIHEEDLVSEPKKGQVPEITDELIGDLQNEVPGMADVDQEELRKGIEDEAGEHFDTVGGDMVTIAKIAMDHILEYPGQKYYTALDQMESELSQAGEQAEAPAPAAEPVAEEPAAEEPVAEPEVDTEAPVEEPMAEAKVAEGTAELAKELKMEKSEVEKGKAANKPEIQNGILGEQPAKKYP